ncbi:DUF459 domain-containing protein [Nitratireductor sp. L1-7-SE]|uniref:DUF459 domain-containing protein n=1 Tax=Nitratireductor rhodophyticola TaxID=2854036 RepID=A0ABS7R9Y4_9HYPH|nr:DUF459 domain-containing protein [Nitratireductor rhodophyticola]MBY8917729.1 DUF459 domain-containing protein [Nitratireductor rhodophyticola]MBY8922440.1 DUF459 domain-containing protein [Nitratireductor rhodophyticola]
MKAKRTKKSDGSGKCIALAVIAFSLAMPASTAIPSIAEAQEYRREQRRGLFDLLFGGALRQRQPERPATRQRSAPRKQQGTQRRRSATRSAAPQPPPPPEVEKLENARVVLVLGDFLAGGLAEGLSSAYAESPGVRVVNRSNGSSGFVRDDYYDWNGEIAGILEDVSPTVVVMMIGSNDRQQLVVDGKREAPRSEAWLVEYTQRVETFAAALEEKKIPLIWSGLPPFKSSSMSSDMLAFNDIYKTAVEAVDGSFVDIWDGFVDENGGFIFTGPDMNGQPVRLRGSDGINLTRSGKRKVAFYVEKPLNKLLGEAVSPDIGELGMESLPALVLHPENPSPVNRTMPISLSDPALDGGLELMGAVVKPIARQERGQSDGATPEPVAQPGRADNFSLRTNATPRSETPPGPPAQATP